MKRVWLVLCLLVMGGFCGATPSLNLYTFSGGNYSNEDILINYSSDGISYSVNTTDWRKNGESLSEILISFDEGSVTEGATLKNYVLNPQANTNATLHTTTTSIDGFIGKTFDMNASQSYITIPDSDLVRTNGTNLTILMWIKLNPYDTITGVLTKKVSSTLTGNDYALWRLNGGLTVYKGNGTSWKTETISVSDNEWTLVGFGWDSDSNQIYTYKNTTRTAGDVLPESYDYTNSEDLTIGKYNTAGSTRLNGYMDELRIFDRLLTEEELQEIYYLEYNGNRNVYPNEYTSVGDNISAAVTINNGAEDLYTSESDNLTVKFYGASLDWLFLNTTTNNFLSSEDLFATWQGNALSDQVSINYFNNSVSDQKLHFSFDQNVTAVSGSVLDISYPYSSSTISTSVANWSNNNCVVGGCYHFNSDYAISVEDDDGEADCVDNCTIMFWYKHYLGGSQGIVGKSTSATAINYNFWDVGTGDLTLYYGNGTAYTSNKIVDYPTEASYGEWNHVTLVKDGASAHIYLDGTLLRTIDMGEGYVNWNNNTADLSLGGYTKTAGFFNGSIDEFHMWDRKLSAEEISYYYTTENSGQVAGIPAESTFAGETWHAEAFSFSNDSSIEYSNLTLDSIEIQQAPPIISSVSIDFSNEQVLYNSDLIGRCKAYDYEGSNVNYEWKWYRDGVEFSSGSLLSQVSNVGVNPSNVSSSSTSQDEEWIFSCRANDSESYGDWSNYSVLLRDITTFYVSAAGNDTTGDGSEGNPWRTITFAIASSNYGDNISVADGIYDEQGLIANKSVNIISENINGAEIQSSGSVNYLVKFSSSNSKVEGFNLTCNNSETVLYGVYLDDNDVSVKNNSITNCNTGVMYNSAKEMNGVEINGNYFFEVSSNIQQFICDQSTISNNIFNISRAMSYGLEYQSDAVCSDSFNLTIDRNRFENYNQSSSLVTLGLNKLGSVQNGQTIIFKNNILGTLEKPANVPYGIYSQYPYNYWIINNTLVLNNTGSSNSAIYTRYIGEDYHIINNTIGDISYLWGSSTYKPTFSPLSSDSVDGVEIIGNNLYLANFTTGIQVTYAYDTPLENISIKDNYVYSTTNSNSYMIAVGTEGNGDRSEIVKNANVSGNTIVSKPYESGDTPNHGIFIGYTHNTYLANNNVSGGLYTYVIKGNQNITNLNNIGSGGYYGMYDKASINGVWSGGVFNGTSATDRCVYISHNPTYNHSSYNNYHYDMLFYNGGQAKDYLISGSDGAFVNVTIINATKWNGTDFADPIIYTGTNSTALVGWWTEVYVEDSDGNALSGAVVKSYRNDSTLVSTETTNSSGIARVISHEYTKGAGDSISEEYEMYYVASYSGVTETSEEEIVTWNNEKTVTLSLPSSDNGGGSSGGSSTAAPTYRPAVEKLESGYEVSLGKNYKVGFEVGGESHSLEVDEIFEDYVRVEIRSDPIILELKVGEIEKVDLDLDGVYDLSVELKGLSVNRADLVLTRIDERYDFGTTNCTNCTKGSEVFGEQGGEDEEDFGLWIGGVVVLILVILGWLGWRNFK